MTEETGIQLASLKFIAAKVGKSAFPTNNSRNI